MVNEINATADESAKTHWSKVLAIVSSIVGLISFAMFVTTYIINRRLESQKERQQQLFLAATQRFTKVLDEKNDQLDDLGNKLANLDRLTSQVNDLHRHIVRRGRIIDTKVDETGLVSDQRSRIEQIYS